MNITEFLDKMEHEGAFYALTSYGLSANDLDSNVAPKFRRAVEKAIKSAKETDALIEQLWELE